jgi:Immunoglobulin-like domain of bacterial spore germination/Sporulation and spore germination
VKRALLLAAAAVFLVAGCGGDDKEATPTETATVTTPVVTTMVRAYFLRDGKVWPAARWVPKTEDATTTALDALDALFAGPTAKESEDLSFKTAIPEQNAWGGDLTSISVGPQRLSRQALAQIVYTLTQFPNVKSVKVEGKRYTRADFEDQTPGILVESPLPFADVSSPIRATGTANTFEATFNYELTDTDGKIVDENFVTATSGTGTRGTFDFTTKKFTVPFSGVGSLVVFERSAEDGSRTKLVEIPLRMSQ